MMFIGLPKVAKAKVLHPNDEEHCKESDEGGFVSFIVAPQCAQLRCGDRKKQQSVLLLLLLLQRAAHDAPVGS